MELEPNLLEWNVNELESKLELEDMKRTHTYVVAKKMTRNCQKMAISETYFFLTKLKNTVDGNFLIYVIALDPIMI